MNFKTLEMQESLDDFGRDTTALLQYLSKLIRTYKKPARKDVGQIGVSMFSDEPGV